MATHSSMLAWRIPWTEEPGRLYSHRVARVGHDLATKPPPPENITKKKETYRYREQTSGYYLGVQ